MTSILDSLQQKKVLVSDGAWGTSLMKMGFELGQCPELWNIEHRNEVFSIARSFIEAGADIIMTNSFGASRFKLERFGLADRVAELNETAAAISRKAAGENVHVMASIGPTGKFLMTGEVTEEELYNAFAEQAVALERGGADACCVETMSALDEAMVAISAVSDNTRLLPVCTFTFDKSEDGSYHTMMGVSPEVFIKGAVESGAKIVGTNCGHGPDNMVEIVEQLRSAHSDVPILVQANAGLPICVNGLDTYPATPDVMAEYVPKLIGAGAGIIGGCCGTTPAHIRAIAAAVRAYLNN